MARDPRSRADPLIVRQSGLELTEILIDWNSSGAQRLDACGAEVDDVVFAVHFMLLPRRVIATDFGAYELSRAIPILYGLYIENVLDQAVR